MLLKKSDKKDIIIITSFIIIIIISLVIGKNQFFIPEDIRSLTTEISGRYLVDETLVLAVIKCESGFKRRAVSLKGACGLMQLTENTFDYICDLKNIKGDIYDPQTNIEAGCAYLKYLSEKFNGLKEIICAYNAGEGTVREWLNDIEYSKNGVDLDIIPYKETEKYHKRVMTYYYFYGGVINESGRSKGEKNLALLRG